LSRKDLRYGRFVRPISVKNVRLHTHSEPRRKHH
jgi:hypothetical protein